MRLCIARQESKPFVGLGRQDRWLNLSLAAQAHAGFFSWLLSGAELRIEEMLWYVEDLSGTLAGFWQDLDRAGALPSYQVEEPLDLLPPITRPSKIVALGRNYQAHADETGVTPPEEPLFFAKAPSSIVGPGAGIVYPAVVTRLDPEIELGVIIGRRAKDVPEDEAMDYVAGYTIVNDVTARAMQFRDIEERKPWFRAKSFDTFTPLGPHLVLKDEIPDPHDLRITLRVNGQVRQDALTAHCIFTVPQIIHYISTFMTLEPGDLIATGTPGGIAPLDRGDLVECTITGLGTLANPVV
ncbi:MAG: fumarylacetoacetate hydrolase family protein [Anaerolineae bacterium]|jgi:2-keto-4-pentenoate hydratase/2-oxohepta-3-ene-1,7-dioic acid hydratase in catechol pathway